jgi:hypothetical protein
MLSVTFTWTDPAVFAGAQSYELGIKRVERRYRARRHSQCDPFDAERPAFSKVE